MAIEDSNEMNYYERDLSKIITRCYSKSISPDKWLSYVRQAKRKHFEDDLESSISAALDALLARTLLSHILVSAPPPSLLLQYLRVAILGRGIEDSQVVANQITSLCSSRDVLITLLAVCISWNLEGPTSLQPASVEAVCVELEAMGFLIALDSEESLLELFRAIRSDPLATPTHGTSPALLLIQATVSLFQMSFSGTPSPLSRTLAIQILSGPANRALSRETSRAGQIEKASGAANESSETLRLVEGGLELCAASGLQVEAASLQSIKLILASLGADSTSMETDSKEPKKSRFHPDLRVPASGQWKGNPRLNALLEPGSSNLKISEIESLIGSETLVLLQYLACKTRRSSSKIEAARLLIQAQKRAESNDEGTCALVHTRFYLSLFLGVTSLISRTDAQEVVNQRKDGFTPGGTRSIRLGSEGALWIDVLAGLIPEILSSLEAQRPSLSSESSFDCVGKAVRAFFACGDEALSACELKHVSSAERSEATSSTDVSMNDILMDTDSQPHRPIRAFLLRSLQGLNLIDQKLVNEISQKSETVSQDLASLAQTFRSEAESSMQVTEGNKGPLEAHAFQRLMSDDLSDLLERLLSDYGAQRAFATQLSEALSFWASSSEHQLETLSHACKVLGENTAVVDALLLYVAPRALLGAMASLFDREDLGQLCDEPITLGGILLFIQLCVQRYQLHTDLDSHLGPSIFLPRFLRSASAVHVLSTLPSEEQTLIDSWITAFFDSEGIPDELIRTSSPQTLLRLAPTLASQCIRASAAGLIDLETLKSGLTYFSNPILSWTLPGVLSRLLQELVSQPPFSVSSSGEQNGTEAQKRPQIVRVAPKDMVKKKVLLEALSMLLVNEGCPSFALQLASSEIKNVINEAEGLASELSEGGSSDLAALRLKFETIRTGLVIDASEALRRLFSDRFGSSISIPELCSSIPSTSTLQYLSTQLIDHSVLSIPAPQVVEIQKSIASKLLLGSTNDLSLLKTFVQSLQLQDDLDPQFNSPSQISLALARSQSLSQTLILATELAENGKLKDQLISLGETLALRLARIQSQNENPRLSSPSNSLPLVAQVLLSVPTPACISQALNTVFYSFLDTTTTKP